MLKIVFNVIEIFKAGSAFLSVITLSHLRQESLVVGSGIAVPFWKGNISRDVFLLFVIHSKEY